MLHTHKIKAETHNGVKTRLFLNFVRSGYLDKDFAKLYSHLLFDWRQETDYADFIEFDEETVLPLVLEAKELNRKPEGLIKEALS